MLGGGFEALAASMQRCTVGEEVRQPCGAMVYVWACSTWCAVVGYVDLEIFSLGIQVTATWLCCGLACGKGERKEEEDGGTHDLFSASYPQCTND